MTWLQVFISAFPQGSLWRERPPFKGRVKVSFCLSPFTPPRCRTSGQKRGVALTTSTPLVRRAVSPGEGGTREAQPRFAFPQRSRDIPVVPRLMRRFGNVPTTVGGGSAL